MHQPAGDEASPTLQRNKTVVSLYSCRDGCDGCSKKFMPNFSSADSAECRFIAVCLVARIAAILRASRN